MHDETRTTDTSMRMGALGVRGEVVSPAEPGGFTLAVTSDTFWVRMGSDPIRGANGNLEEAKPTRGRVRLSLQGSSAFETGIGTLTPSIEVGLRHDGGDADTGTGVEVGGAITYRGERASIEASMRTLVAHEQTGYDEWGGAVTMRIEPGASGRGLSLTLAPRWGAAASGTDRLWGVQDTSRLDEGAFDAETRLAAEMGYGLAAPRNRGVVTPFAGLVLSEEGRRTWRSGARWQVSPDSTLGFEVTRESGGDGEARGSLRLGVQMRF